MATTTPETFAGFNEPQKSTVNRLGTYLKILAPLLLLLGAARLVLAVAEIIKGNWGGLLVAPEGILLAFAGLASLTGAADVSYLRTVKGREKEHCTNALKSLNVACKEHSLPIPTACTCRLSIHPAAG